MNDLPDFNNWPALEKPKEVYHMGLITPEAAESLSEKNWRVVDVRTLDSGPEAVRAYFEGVRVGTIEHDRSKDKVLELEARSHGLVTGKAIEPKKRNKEESLDNLFKLDNKYLEDTGDVVGKRSVGGSRKPRKKNK